MTRLDADIARQLPEPAGLAATNGSPVRLNPRSTHELRAAVV
jgi:hypothetical protein